MLRFAALLLWSWWVGAGWQCEAELLLRTGSVCTAVCTAASLCLWFLGEKKKIVPDFQPDPSDTRSVNRVFSRPVKICGTSPPWGLVDETQSLGVFDAVCLCLIMCENECCACVHRLYVCHHLKLAKFILFDPIDANALKQSDMMRRSRDSSPSPTLLEGDLRQNPTAKRETGEFWLFWLCDSEHFPLSTNQPIYY